METERRGKERVSRGRNRLGRQLAWGAGLMLAFLLVATGMNHLYLSRIQWTCWELEENLGEQKFLSRISAQIAACKHLEGKIRETMAESARQEPAVEAWMKAAKALVDMLAEKDVQNTAGAKESWGFGVPWKTWQEWAHQYVNSTLGRIEGEENEGIQGDSPPWKPLTSPNISVSQTTMEQFCRAVETERNRLQANAQALVHRLGFLLARHRRWIASGTVVALLAGVLALIWMGKHVLGRVRLLTEAATQLAEGKQPIHWHSHSQDELAELGCQLQRLSEKQPQVPLAGVPERSSKPAPWQQWSQWIAKAADRLLEPVEKILASNDMLLQAIHQPELVQTLYAIDRHGRMVRTMVDNCRLWAELEAHALRPTPKRFSPRELFIRLDKAAQPLAKAKGLDLHLQWEGPSEETFVSDANLLERILLHLLSWSIESTELGTIQLKGRLVSDQKSPHLQIQLIDSGQAITSNALPLATGDLSTQSSQDPESPPVETIGWLVCRKLVHLLGGALEIKNISGDGTIVVLSLPMLKAAELPSAGRLLPSGGLLAPQDQLQLGQKLHGRVLLAEDGPENQRLISFLLRKAGLQVDIAADGHQAVQRVLQSMKAGTGQRPYDLILMDMLLPGMDGFQATRYLRQAGYQGPILAITALSDQYSSRQCLETGCTDYLVKPFEREKLLALVVKYLPTASAQPGNPELAHTTLLSP
ncbi:MAG: response regulator [Thermoguttaceae bacterium]|nr:response regulator [Thermoguttaceae bacterium]MDW8039515.1 response regulator [Thermoguttaceae bacterium]